MAPEVQRYIDAAWLLAGIVWLVCAFTAKPNERRQSASSRVTQTVFFAIAVILLTNARLRFSTLGIRFIANTAAAAKLGVDLTFAGVAFAIWARLHIGRNWSGTVTIKTDHTLVRTGPYSIVRHPIYTGLLMATLGTAVAIGEIRGLFAVVVAFIGVKFKAALEEQFMTEKFGPEYVQYQREVKGLIPFVW
jgi:protein-S-isoprenylcysteine O-methyltransferase Ste14